MTPEMAFFVTPILARTAIAVTVLFGVAALRAAVKRDLYGELVWLAATAAAVLVFVAV